MRAEAAARPLLEIAAVSKRFGGLVAVDGASFDVRRGSITALIGPNGAGKSTLFNVVSGFVRADAGEVLLDGQSIFRLRAHAIARRGLVRTFQLTKALSVMSVLDNMLLAAPGHPGERLALAALRPVWRERERAERERARELLDVFGLAAKAGEYAGTLSGGQRKLLELARALMLEPTILLLDEPLAGVNRTLGRRLLEHIERVREERGLTILLVEHDIELVATFTNRSYVLDFGRVLTSGPTETVMASEEVRRAYLGDVGVPV